jgi:hypothetical protein
MRKGNETRKNDDDDIEEEKENPRARGFDSRPVFLRPHPDDEPSFVS